MKESDLSWLKERIAVLGCVFGKDYFYQHGVPKFLLSYGVICIRDPFDTKVFGSKDGLHRIVAFLEIAAEH